MTVRLPFVWARANGVLIETDSQGQRLVICPRTPQWALAEMRRVHGSLPIQSVSDTEFETRIARTYADTDDAAAIVDSVSNDYDLDRLMQAMPEVEDLLEVHDDAPVIRMINALITQAVRDGASDIHLEAFETRSVVRYRVDGTLRTIVAPRRALHNAMISRIKIMAGLDIAEKRLPQDGRIALLIGGKAVDVRVSTLPTGHGERAVLRLLDKTAGRLTLEHLGMAPSVLSQLDTLIHRPHGIVLVTGPTGSGKSTTLYAALSRLDTGTANILTVEDPIEYDLPGVGQTQVNPRIDLSFARALRAILRQDPDIIMIGEIRDLETAQIAVQAALTGHLVLATLHTNDAVASITRLTDMGIEPFLLASTLQGVLAQRLFRKLCRHCKMAQPDGSFEPAPDGCVHCGNTGYSGRSGIHELLVIDEQLREMIHDETSEQFIRQKAIERGMRTLNQDGQRWVESGDTTAAEIIRITRDP
ncbi:type II secretion system ATPase GspE [Orrella marina]|uniref:Type II secretion system protein E n=1 Tax=Orrella marina TaxID=2163011 RepID=A0A2R4XKR9_9BURK|nr:type II secretion system ATPase GspE [Orrella marina]AWB34406.1 type II secretion system protein GspE [Orrella marina]